MQGRRHTREDSGLVLDRQGRWLHDGIPVEHPRIVEVFSHGLERDPQGRYVLRVGADWCFVTVEDAATQVISARVEEGGGEVGLVLSNGRAEILRPGTLAQRGGVLYCETETRLLARFTSVAQSALAPLLDERPGGYVLLVAGTEHPIASLPPVVEQAVTDTVES